MNELALSRPAVNAFVKADPSWNPLPPVLPDLFLRPALPPVDEDHYPNWKAALGLLPAGRQRRVKNCRRNALHIRKHTERGSVEAVNPIACGDRVACPCCATKYAHERAWHAAQKLATISLTAANYGVWAPAPIHALQFRATVPEWLASVKVRGCDQAEVANRLCSATSGCQACLIASTAHSGAARIETEFAHWIVARWLKLRPDTGGVRHTSVRQDTVGGPIQITITIHVPAVCVAVFSGPKIAGIARAQRRSFDAITEPDIEQLQADWIQFITANYAGATAALDHDTVIDWDSIWENFRHTHAAPMGTWNRTIEGLSPLDTVTPDVALTFARAAGLAPLTEKGKARRVQRTAWFGVFGGRHQLEALYALEIFPESKEPHSTIEVINAVRVLAFDGPQATLQNLRTAEMYEVPRDIVHMHDTVDSSGRPTQATDETSYVHESVSRLKAKAKIHADMNLLIDAGSDQIASEDQPLGKSNPSTRQDWKRKLRVEAFEKYDFTLPTPKRRQ